MKKTQAKPAKKRAKTGKNRTKPKNQAKPV